MAKRSFDGGDLQPAVVAKKPRLDIAGDHDYASELSNEVILRILSFLPIRDLLNCGRLSRKFNHLADDALLWKAAFYHRFILPRIRQLPLAASAEAQRLSFTDRFDKYLAGSDRRMRGRFDWMGWKGLYTLRTNWSRGISIIHEIPVGERSLKLPVLMKLHGGVIYTVAVVEGLCAWSPHVQSLKLKGALLASLRLRGRPTSLAVNEALASEDANLHTLVVGFEDGSFAMYTFRKDDDHFDVLHEHPAGSNGALVGLALHSPFLATMTASHLLSIYRLSWERNGTLGPPRVVHSVASQAGNTPVAVTLRRTGETTIASLAYPTLPGIGEAWTIQMQEIHLSLNGKLLKNRSAASPYDTSLARGQQRRLLRPSSVAYAHPYLLVAHKNNTLTMFLVSSTVEDLAIGRPQRLWGHTSAVSLALVEDKGKAVSLSGDEVRVWELEGSHPSRVAQSVRIRARRGEDRHSRNRSVAHVCVGFDDERVVVMREPVEDQSTLIVYDFK